MHPSGKTRRMFQGEAGKAAPRPGRPLPTLGSACKRRLGGCCLGKSLSCRSPAIGFTAPTGHEREPRCRSWARSGRERMFRVAVSSPPNDGYLMHDPKRSSTRGTGSRAERYRVTGVSSIPGTGCVLGLRTAKHRAAGSKVFGHLGFFSRSFARDLVVMSAQTRRPIATRLPDFR